MSTVPRSQFTSSLNIAGAKSEPQLFSGLAFPFGQTVLSVFAPKGDEEVIRSAIENILFTRLGERVMRPEFGSPVQDMIFEPNDQILLITLSAAIQEALGTWETRAVLGNPNVSLDGEKVVVRVPLTLQRPNGAREVGVPIEITRESLFGFPAIG